MHGKVEFEETPLCVTDEEYEIWSNSIGIARVSRSYFCADCTKEYADQMRIKGLCQYPSVYFCEGEDGGIEGKLPSTRQGDHDAYKS